jgi:DNA transposition AAA+ family ATPase
MKTVFVETGNVNQFVSTAKSLFDREAGVPGLALVHGTRGLGKTKTAIWWASQNNGIYIRAKKEWSANWMLEELAIELGLVPRRRKKDLFEDVITALLDHTRLVIIDEVNLPIPAILETIRDIHDITGNPFLFIGHDGVVKRLKRMAPLFDRLLYITEFKALTEEDLGKFASTCLDLPVDDSALEAVRQKTDGNFRKSVVAFKRMETQAKARRLGVITAELLSKQKRAA